MRKKFLVCILLPCCILIAACGHTADTKNDLLSENITSDTETDTQTSDYEKYNNYGSTEEQMDEAITETSETASSSEENDLPEQSLQKYSDDWDESQILEELQKRNTYHDYCSFYPEYVRYMENVMEVRDISMNIYPIYATDTRYYQASDFSNVPPLIIHLAKNEIYARHGYIFKNQDLNAYFLSQLWYLPEFDSETFDSSVFNEFGNRTIRSCRFQQFNFRFTTFQKSGLYFLVFYSFYIVTFQSEYIFIIRKGFFDAFHRNTQMFDVRNFHNQVVFNGIKI